MHTKYIINDLPILLCLVMIIYDTIICGKLKENNREMETDVRLRNVTGSREMIAANDFVVHEPKESRGHWRELFGNDNPIHIEIGMGKGRFIIDFLLLLYVIIPNHIYFI